LARINDAPFHCVEARGNHVLLRLHRAQIAHDRSQVIAHNVPALGQRVALRLAPHQQQLRPHRAVGMNGTWIAT